MPDREREREYWGDVVYDVWRRGGNSDAVDPDWARERMLDGLDADEAAAQFVRKHRRRPEPEPVHETDDDDQAPLFDALETRPYPDPHQAMRDARLRWHPRGIVVVRDPLRRIE